MIILKWLEDYLNTPEIELDLATQVLGIFALGLIAFVIINVIALVLWLVHTYFENHDN